MSATEIAMHYVIPMALHFLALEAFLRAVARHAGTAEEYSTVVTTDTPSERSQSSKAYL